jgi:hypothetical protein
VADHIDFADLRHPRQIVVAPEMRWNKIVERRLIDVEWWKAKTYPARLRSFKDQCLVLTGM